MQARDRKAHELDCPCRKVHWALRFDFARLKGTDYPGKIAGLRVLYEPEDASKAEKAELQHRNLIQGTMYAEAHFDEECRLSTDVLLGSTVAV